MMPKAIERWFKDRNDKFILDVHSTWGHTLHEGAPYCTIFFKEDFPIDKKRSIYASFNVARSLGHVMCTGKRVLLDYGNTSSYTDGVKVVVATDYFDDPDLSHQKAIDVFLGLAVHEYSHIEYTDNALWKAEIGDNPIFHHIWNLLEDEMIERHTCATYPGYSHFLAATKDYYFRQKYLAEYEDLSGKEPAEQLMHLMHRFLRYPVFMDETLITEHEPVLEEIAAVCVPLATNTSGILIQAREVYEILKRYYADYVKDTLEKYEEEKQQLEQLAKELEDFIKQIASAINELLREQSLTGNDKSGEITDKKLEKSAKEEELKNVKEQIKATEEKIKKEADLDSSSAAAEATMLTIVMESGTTSEESEPGDAKSERIEGLLASDIKNDPKLKSDIEVRFGDRYVPGTEKNTYFIRATEDSHTYKFLAHGMSAQASALRRLLRFNSGRQKVKLHGLRSGHLDPNKMVEAVQDVETVYLRHGEKTHNKANVVLLIDESGSMGCSGRIESAQKCAILFNEALKTMGNVNLFIYGHTADYYEDSRRAGDTFLYVYKEPSMRKPYALGSVESRANNRDHMAIIETHRRVRKHTKDPVIMFVISDGNPNADGISGDSGMRLVREAVKKASKDNFHVVQIAIGGAHDSHKMFEHWVEFTNLEQLPSVLSKMMMQNLKKMLTSKVVWH